LRRREFIAACCYAACAGGARGSGLIEPHMHFTPTGGMLQVAVTLDACMGETDMRILGPLIENAIPVTIFATKRWLDRNPATIKLLRQHPDLFVVENHGAKHLSAVIGNDRPYGLLPAGTAAAVAEEVRGGAEAITHAFGTTPKWYRDATALYSPSAMEVIGSMGFRIAGFSLNGDFGASASASMAHRRIAGAKSGDVVISHINQPNRSAGAGVISGILALKARGFTFVHLDGVAMVAIS
jgi:peptidoglycan/xylan/chitin deacetylase (PgdA/CDA1 family)